MWNQIEDVLDGVAQSILRILKQLTGGSSDQAGS